MTKLAPSLGENMGILQHLNQEIQKILINRNHNGFCTGCKNLSFGFCGIVCWGFHIKVIEKWKKP